jgi:hypothetical protein
MSVEAQNRSGSWEKGELSSPFLFSEERKQKHTKTLQYQTVSSNDKNTGLCYCKAKRNRSAL